MDTEGSYVMASILQNSDSAPFSCLLPYSENVSSNDNDEHSLVKMGQTTTFDWWQSEAVTFP